jgi:pimeloyl-ACP methyl ester carboxylesterase
MIQLIRLSLPNDQPPLYVVPGLDGTIGSVEPVVKRLAATREVFVVDYSGETQTTLEGLAAEIAASLRAEGRPTFDLLGQSIGTILTAQVASLHNLPVRRVALTCTFTILRWRLLRVVAAVTKVTPRWLYRLTSPLTISLSCGPVGDGGHHPAFEGTRNADQRSAAKRTAWQIDRDFAIDLARIQQPLLILMGDSDRFVPDATAEIAKLRRMFAGRADTRVDVIPGAGHIFLPSLAIRLAAAKIEEFLR